LNVRADGCESRWPPIQLRPETHVTGTVFPIAIIVPFFEKNGQSRDGFEPLRSLGCRASGRLCIYLLRQDALRVESNDPVARRTLGRIKESPSR
jgi:hypothetical protein